MWDQGDFNYDGTVNAEDFTPFAHDLGQTADHAAGPIWKSRRTASALPMSPQPSGPGLALIVAAGVSLSAIPNPGGSFAELNS